MQLQLHQRKGNCNVLSSAKFYASLCDSVIEQCDVSAHDDNGGIYKVTFKHNNGGLAEKIVSNGGSLCNKLHSLTTYNDNSFALSDTGDSYIKAYKPTANNVLLYLAMEKAQEKEVKPRFSSQ